MKLMLGLHPADAAAASACWARTPPPAVRRAAPARLSAGECVVQRRPHRPRDPVVLRAPEARADADASRRSWSASASARPRTGASAPIPRACASGSASRRRCSASPRVLLLDEPTTGLDPALRQSFYEIVEELRGRGATVLLSSHALTELEERAEPGDHHEPRRHGRRRHPRRAAPPRPPADPHPAEADRLPSSTSVPRLARFRRGWRRSQRRT